MFSMIAFVDFFFFSAADDGVGDFLSVRALVGLRCPLLSPALPLAMALVLDRGDGEAGVVMVETVTRMM